jgi:phosphodiesterase/alkaline phosphatase D-like protein
VVINGLPATGIWALTRTPGGTTTTGTGTSATITGLAVGTYTYIVANASGCNSLTSANVVINAQPATPTAPTAGTITQPTCALATGSVVLNGLPATGTWTITRTPGEITSTGTGLSTTISGIDAGTITFKVTNVSGCSSLASEYIIINTQPLTPTAPTVGTITHPTCTLSTGGVVLNGLPGTGTWTLTRTPGGTTTTGTGISSTITGLATGTYTYTVTNASGCNSVTSGNVIINAQPATPTAPISNDATSILKTSFTANWNTSPTAAGYRVDVSTDIGFATLVVGFNNIDVSNVTTFGITGLVANTSYYYRVRAYNLCGTSQNSVVITTTTLPDPPAGPIANPATSIVQTSLTANWSTSATATGYRLDVATNVGFTAFVAGFNNKDVSNVTSYSVMGLIQNTTYYYRLRAYNTGGTSPNSGVITTTTLPDPPAAPIANPATSIVQTSLMANWSTSATATGYRLDVATNVGFTAFVAGFNNKDVSNVTSYIVTGLIQNTTYYYRLRAYNTGGTSPNSGLITTTTLPDPPAAPTANPATSIVQTSLTANWSTSATATGYRLDVATNVGFTAFVTGFNDKDVSNVASYSVTGLSANTPYYYRLRAYNTGGASPNSGTITTTTLPNPPAAPTSKPTTNLSQTGFTANWNASASATGYRFDVATNSAFTSFVVGFNDKDVSNVTILNVTGLSAITQYYYRLRGYNTGGIGANSIPLTVTTLTNPPAAPIGLTASSCNNLVTLNWRKNSDPYFIRYHIYGGLTNNPTAKIDSTSDAISDTTKIISGLTSGQTYYFRVTAVNYDGPESPFSNQSSAIVKTGVIPKIKVKFGDLLICYNLGDSIASYQWFNGNTIIPSAIGQYYTSNKQLGSYSVETIDKNGCKNSSKSVAILSTKSLILFPNPASVSFSLNLTDASGSNDASDEKALVSMFNSSGVKVMEFQAINLNDELLKAISVSHLDNGVYVVKVLLNQKDLYYTKIVVLK